MARKRKNPHKGYGTSSRVTGEMPVGTGAKPEVSVDTLQAGDLFRSFSPTAEEKRYSLFVRMGTNKHSDFTPLGRQIRMSGKVERAMEVLVADVNTRGRFTEESVLKVWRYWGAFMGNSYCPRDKAAARNKGLRGALKGDVVWTTVSVVGNRHIPQTESYSFGAVVSKAKKGWNGQKEWKGRLEIRGECEPMDDMGGDLGLTPNENGLFLTQPFTRLYSEMGTVLVRREGSGEPLGYASIEEVIWGLDKDGRRFFSRETEMEKQKRLEVEAIVREAKEAEERQKARAKAKADAEAQEAAEIAELEKQLAEQKAAFAARRAARALEKAEELFRKEKYKVAEIYEAARASVSSHLEDVRGEVRNWVTAMRPSRFCLTRRKAVMMISEGMLEAADLHWFQYEKGDQAALNRARAVEEEIETLSSKAAQASTCRTLGLALKSVESLLREYSSAHWVKSPCGGLKPMEELPPLEEISTLSEFKEVLDNCPYLDEDEVGEMLEAVGA